MGPQAGFCGPKEAEQETLNANSLASEVSGMLRAEPGGLQVGAWLREAWVCFSSLCTCVYVCMCTCVCEDRYLNMRHGNQVLVER